MSILIDVSPERKGGPVNFDSWDGLNEYEKLAAKGIADGVENSLETEPPALHIEANSDGDLLFVVTLEALGGDAADAPEFHFQFRNMLPGIDDDDRKGWCSQEDAKFVADAFRKAADEIEKLGADE